MILIAAAVTIWIARLLFLSVVTPLCVSSSVYSELQQRTTAKRSVRWATPPWERHKYRNVGDHETLPSIDVEVTSYICDFGQRKSRVFSYFLETFSISYSMFNYRSTNFATRLQFALVSALYWCQLVGLPTTNVLIIVGVLSYGSETEHHFCQKTHLNLLEFIKKKVQKWSKLFWQNGKKMNFIAFNEFSAQWCYI